MRLFGIGHWNRTCSYTELSEVSIAIWSTLLGILALFGAQLRIKSYSCWKKTIQCHITLWLFQITRIGLPSGNCLSSVEAEYCWKTSCTHWASLPKIQTGVSQVFVQWFLIFSIMYTRSKYSLSNSNYFMSAKKCRCESCIIDFTSAKMEITSAIFKKSYFPKYSIKRCCK